MEHCLRLIYSNNNIISISVISYGLNVIPFNMTVLFQIEISQYKNKVVFMSANEATIHLVQMLEDLSNHSLLYEFKK